MLGRVFVVQVFRCVPQRVHQALEVLVVVHLQRLDGSPDLKNMKEGKKTGRKKKKEGRKKKKKEENKGTTERERRRRRKKRRRRRRRKRALK